MKNIATLKNKIIVILGPTASGKTSLSLKLAKKFSGEIISADSRQIYKGMDIGTAKPTNFEMSEVAHWLVDIKNPDQPYSVAEYKKDATEAIKNILERGKLPILVGGTGLYIKSVVENLDIPKVEADPVLRQKIEEEAKERGLDYVFDKLIKLDPEAAYIVDPKNPRRVVRALEVTLLTNKPFSKQRKVGEPIFDVLEIGISVPKEKLQEKISQRVDEMMKDGLVDEIKNLTEKFGNQQAFDAIGYREIVDYLSGKSELQKAVKDMKNNTWHYAKRQMTWFNADKKIHWITSEHEAEKLLENFTARQ